MVETIDADGDPEGSREPEFSPSPTRLLYALRLAHLAVEARKEAALASIGILPSHYAVLINTWAHPGATGAELARHLGVTPQNIASLVVRLVDRGLLTRTPHPRHRQVLEVHLSEAGSQVLRAADAEVAALEGQVTAVLDEHLGEAAADQLRTALEHLRAAVTAAP